MVVEERRIDGVLMGYGRIHAARYHPRGAAVPLEAFAYHWDEAGSESGGFYTRDGHSIQRFFLKSPLNYRRISSHFTHKRFHPILKKYRPHLGVDYAAPMGTPVVALGNGKVESVGTRGGYGKTVRIQHNKTYLTQYAHLSKYAAGVRTGTRVKQGQVIGYVGSTGLSTGPHLDFRMQENGKWVNPLTVGGGQSEPIPGARRAGFTGALQAADRLLDGLEPGQGIAVALPGPTAPVLAASQLDTPGTP